MFLVVLGRVVILAGIILAIIWLLMHRAVEVTLSLQEFISIVEHTPLLVAMFICYIVGLGAVISGSLLNI